VKTGDGRLEPCHVAALDQVVAAYTQWLTRLADSYHCCRLHEGDLVTLGVATDWFADEFDHYTLASLLGVAVRMLSER
jgi:hypothetical protein